MRISFSAITPASPASVEQACASDEPLLRAPRGFVELVVFSVVVSVAAQLVVRYLTNPER